MGDLCAYSDCCKPEPANHTQNSKGFMIYIMTPPKMVLLFPIFSESVLHGTLLSIFVCPLQR